MDDKVLKVLRIMEHLKMYISMTTKQTSGADEDSVTRSKASELQLHVDHE